ncbi:ATP phosphoribosyltransferase regulatory subunit [Peptoclostridium litorale DSM 5388]|uniref:ATP phosphoribosyltransferase regulatory subunit n=1 Tax=Peptoclostridium litorale DSM 5388 TaxID=1121324 RepID=A0A069RDI4_PEPLI|nr:ATP phosphoribosyltransferase regulatory subunit [Peptoclostridium litorale]KDR95099.1 ATP phosphoribosyltransferase regulatory subunit HisZ [Peptoclostridium litorale DSM 5388]SIN75025.1 ATP phosphoribosyltransferase regulatory subunit [Peptoclostridium litorale DSM 5388]
MNTIFYKVPTGTSDEFYEFFQGKESIVKNFKKIFKSYAYKQISTPVFEYYDFFVQSPGTIKKDELFKLVDINGDVLVLRPDLTIPIARMAVENRKKFKDYLKLSYVSKVFRIDNRESEKKKEFTQAGVEYFGNQSPDADAEVINIAIKTLLSSGAEKIQIDIGQSSFYKGLIDEVDLSEEEKDRLREIIENKNFVELEKFLIFNNIDAAAKEAIVKIPELYGNTEKVISEAKQICLNRDMEEAIENLEKVYHILLDYGYENYISLDLGLINHLDYYTGVIFKGYMANHGRIVLSGGRYDKLTEKYGEYIPATGFGINVDEFILGLKKTGIKTYKEHSTDYLIVYSHVNRKDVIQISDRLRNDGFVVETDSFKGYEHHLGYARENGIRKFVICEADKVFVEDMESLEKKEMDIESFRSSLSQ